jgi:esterase/lipase superfamily enzyme
MCWDERLRRQAPCTSSAQNPPAKPPRIQARKAPLTRGLKRAKPIIAATSVPENVCKTQNICTPVRIFFGTEREKQQGKARVIFTGDRAGKLQLGRAIVTVPKAADRERGEIPRPQWWERVFLRVSPEGDPAKHFTILSNGFKLFSNPEDFIAEVREHMKDAGAYKDHAFVFVHGYNVPFDAALYRTAQIAYDLGHEAGGHQVPFGTAFLYSWPSSGETYDYAYDLESARFTVTHLKDFIGLVTARSGAKEIHLIAHSMGNVALMNALHEFSRDPTNAGAKLNQVVLAAPDMDVREFERLARAITPIAKNVTLYASSKDVAMMASRKVHRDQARAGDVTEKGPVIVDKVYSIDISALSTDFFSIRHSDYADKRELLRDMNIMFVREEQPPHKRNLNFRRLARDGGEFWRYAQ